MKKYLFLQVLFLLLCSGCFSQEEKKNINSSILEAPDDWGKETFPLPLAFAPKLDFFGIEEVRFAPKWADKSSPEFWTYAFAWRLEGNARLTNNRLKELVEDYFSGLTAAVGKDNGIEAGRITKASAFFNSKQKPGSWAYFEGKVELFDAFFTHDQIKLNVKVQSIYCPDINKSLVVFFFSPKSFENKVWKMFSNIKAPNDCKAFQVKNEQPYRTKETEHYELIIPKGKQNGVLILFPGYPEIPLIVKSEFKIIEPAVKEGISVALMKFNQRIWLEDNEKDKLTAILNQMFEDNGLEKENIYIGGFSSGGNVSLLISNHLMKSGKGIKPEGVFIIDSPVDLLGLYENAKRNIRRNISSVSVQESQMIIDQFESKFGKPENGIEQYQKYSVYNMKTQNTNNLSHLKDVKIRLYTEPDTLWWRENRMNEYEEMNAYFIKNLSDQLVEKFGSQVEYIPTENRGYRSNGERHPHAWSIVDVNDLILWIREE